MRPTTQGWVIAGRLAAALGLIGLAVLSALLGQTPQPIRITTPPDQIQATVRLSADKVIGWTEGNLDILLARGNVLLEQGLLRIRMREAVVWMNTAEVRRGQPLRLWGYGEGDVRVGEGTPVQTGASVLFDLQTRGEFRLQNPQMEKRPAADDPLYRRALAAWQTPPTPITPPIQPPTVPVPAPSSPSASPPPTAPPPPSAAPNVTPSKPRPPAQPEKPPPVAGPLLPLPGIGRSGPPRIRSIRISPRGSSPFSHETFPIGPNEYATVVLGGVVIYVEDDQGNLTLSTDRAVIWSRNVGGERLLSQLQVGRTSDEHYEVYLEGHVEVRQTPSRGPLAGKTRLIQAEQAYFDLQRNVGVLRQAQLVIPEPRLPLPVYLRASEIRQVAADTFEANDVEVFASRLPSDPGVVARTPLATLQLRELPVRGLFGWLELDPQTGRPRTETELFGTAQDFSLWWEGIPFFYWPYVQGDLRDPLGPLDRVRVRADRVFGFGLMLDWDIFELLGGERPANTRWNLETDYLSERGPALGTIFQSQGQNLFGIPGRYQTEIHLWHIYDTGTDRLGGIRTFTPPTPWRGRDTIRHRQELGEDWLFLGQFSWLSDRNFLEQFFKREFDEGINQETFAYLKWQRDDLAASLLVQPHLRAWVNETSWLPRGDFFILGQDFLETFTWFSRASAGYAIFSPSDDIPPGYHLVPIPGEFLRFRPLPPSADFPHYGRRELARFDWWNELDWPFQLGPFKIVPYGLFDATWYQETETDPDGAARIYYGGGARASLPLSRIYPEISSVLWNLNGIAHKLVFWTDYRYVRSDQNFRELILLDRLDDDATDQARRDLRTYFLTFFPPGSREFFLATSPFFDPQLYALRRGFEYSPETLDDIQFLRFGLDQRWQTKRGFPGQQHIVDWMTLNLRATYFPDPNRDNFGHNFAFLEYDYIWHLGDRTTLVSNAWVEPYARGARLFSLGMFLDRGEHMSFYLGYRMLDPIGSDAVIASASYQLNPKWAVTLATTYDFGIAQNLGQSFIITRTGTDLRVSLGLTYNPLTNNFGVAFTILPTLAPSRLQPLPLSGL
ncbi:MAG: hypothetical protein RMI91_11335 [Gemmatales bacterium]|nr:hypothetical protein [Gemmatales bacterium]